MLLQEQELSSLLQQFIEQAQSYLEQPGLMKALELDKLCMKLYPMVARQKKHMDLSNKIRDFGRGLPRSEPEQLQILFDDIIAMIQDEALIDEA